MVYDLEMKSEVKRIIDEEGDHLTYVTINQEGKVEVDVQKIDLDATPEDISNKLKKCADDLMDSPPAGVDITTILDAEAVLRKEAELVPDLKNSRKK